MVPKCKRVEKIYRHFLTRHAVEKEEGTLYKIAQLNWNRTDKSKFCSDYQENKRSPTEASDSDKKGNTGSTNKVMKFVSDAKPEKHVLFDASFFGK